MEWNPILQIQSAYDKLQRTVRAAWNDIARESQEGLIQTMQTRY